MSMIQLRRVLQIGMLFGLVLLLGCSGFKRSDDSQSASLQSQPPTMRIGAPMVQITAPAEGSYITTANYENFSLSGTCSEEGLPVRVSGPVTGSTLCSQNLWSVSLDVSFVFDGGLTFSVNHADALGNEAPTVSRNFIKDTIAPFRNSIQINDGVTPATSTSATLTLGSEGASQMYITNTAGCLSGGSFQPYATSLPWTLFPVDGIATVYARYRDEAGNLSPCVKGSLAMNITEPPLLPTVAITSPAAGTVITSASVTSFELSGSCSESGREVALSGAVSTKVLCDQGIWVALLNLSTAPEGTVTLQADHQNASGAAAAPSVRSFLKDTTAPGPASLVINSGDAKTSTTAVSLTLTAAGAAEMYVTNVSGCGSGGTWEVFAGMRNWTLGQTNGEATVYAKFRDSVGNVSACVADTILHETPAVPALTISPATVTLTSGASQTVKFTAAGGTPPYAFQVVSGSGSIGASTGMYTSAADASGKTIVRVEDSAEGSADAEITHERSAGGDGIFLGTNGPVRAIGVDSDGNRYIGGSFTQVIIRGEGDSKRGLTARNLAKILANGEVDLGFLARGGADDDVNAIAVSGRDIFVGGEFIHLHGSMANHIGRLTPAGDVNLQFSPQSSANGFGKAVHALVVRGSTLYVGGDFHTYRGLWVRGLARVSTAGVLDQGFTGKGAVNGRVHALALDPSGEVLYLGGKFNKFKDLKAHRIAKVFTVSGALDTAFNPQDGAIGKTNGDNNDVRTLAVDPRNGGVYVGGKMNRYRGGFAGPLMRLHSDGRLDTAFRAETNGTVHAIAVSAAGTEIYVGGEMETINGITVNGIAKLNDQGEVKRTFSPATGSVGVSGTGAEAPSVLALVIGGADLLVGGAFSKVRDLPAFNYAVLSLSGSPELAP